jgi:hypothetical protein
MEEDYYEDDYYEDDYYEEEWVDQKYYQEVTSKTRTPSQEVLDLIRDNDGEVTSWCVHDKDDKGYLSRVWLNQVCHVNFNRAGNKDSYAITTDLRGNDGNLVRLCGREVAEKYWSFIFNRRYSPWGRYYDRNQFHRDDKGHMYAVTLYINDNSNAKMLANLLIASRTPWEYPLKTLLWYDACKLGLNRMDALYLSSILQKNKDGIIQQGYGRGHLPFDEDLSYVKLVERKPDVCDAPFKEKVSYSGGTNAWRVEDGLGIKAKVVFSAEERKEYKGPFIKLWEYKNYGEVTKLLDLKGCVKVFKQLKKEKKLP